MRWWLPLFVVVVFGGGLVTKVLMDNAEDALLCEAINENRSTMRNLLISARDQTPRERLTKRARRFYREQIRAVRPLDCGSFDRDSLRRLQREGGDASARSNPAADP